MQNTLVLVDGSSYFYRAFHALPPLTNSKGQALGAVYGVVNMVKRLMKDYPTDYFTLVFDAKGKTFRDELYSEYKANRPPMPEELRSQFEPMIEVLDAMGLPIVIMDGVEADDVIGTLCVEALKQGMKTVVSTGDKDLAQLVNEQVTLINTMSNTKMDIEGVKEKFGVPPELIIDYLSLIGDKSDNIPGVEKVGPKTAVKWLEQYGSLDAVMENADSIKGKVGENLKAALSHLPLSKTLVTIKTDLEQELEFEKLKKIPPATEKLIELCEHYEFKTWLKSLQESEGLDAPAEVIEKHYKTISSLEELKAYCEKIEEKACLAIDTETTSLDAISAKLVGISLSREKHEGVYLPIAHQEYENNLALLDVIEYLNPILSSHEIKKVGQNLKYDLNVLEKAGFTFRGALFDTMLESYIINSTSSRHGLDTLAQTILGVETIKFEEVAGKGKKQVTFDHVAVDKATEYACEDTDITLQLHKKFYPRIKAMPKLKSVFESIEMPLMPILAEMEKTGVLIDPERLKTQSETLKKRIEVLEEMAYQLAGEEFNLASPKQLQHILFTKLGLPVVQKTAKGQASTAENVLHELAREYELPEIILEHRSLTKLVSTYLDALPQKINAETGRVHTSYNQAVTSTGRLSSSDPNLQNIPIRKSEGRDIRRAFIAKEGFKLLACDYSQIELRIMAHLSNDQNLLRAFSEGLDIHQATASEVFATPLDEVSSDQRRSAKAVNFGLIYGMSSFGLAKQLDIPRGLAQEYIDLYFARYPGVKEYMESTKALAKSQGYVETLMGRRLYLPDINAKNKMLVKAAERLAINAPMQGTAADLIKLAMIEVNAWLKNSELDCKMIMQVHDELVFEVNNEHLESASIEIKSLMENALELKVPLLVSCDSGDNWEAAH
jgi:DNA polymerase-1